MSNGIIRPADVVVSEGPGSVEFDDSFGNRAADVALDVDSVATNEPDGSTVCAITLYASAVEDWKTTRITAELTRDDARRLAGLLLSFTGENE